MGYLGGGKTAIKFCHIVDRRESLEKVKDLKLRRPPRSQREKHISRVSRVYVSGFAGRD